MATNTILNKNQVPLATAFKDVLNVFAVIPQIPTTTPTQDAEIASKKYVDDRMSSSLAGLELKQSVRVATTASVGTYTATAGTSGKGQITAAPSTLDGVALAVGNRILDKDNATASARGIYVVTTVGTGATGVWDRATDFDSDAEASPSSFTFVEEGTALSDTAWVLITNAPIVLGGASGTALTWTQFAGAGTGVSAVSIATLNGLQGLSSGGNTPVLTLGTSLGAGNVRSNGSGSFVLGSISLASEVSGVLPLANGGTGVSSITGIIKGNGTSAMSAAASADVVTLIGSTAVTNVNNANITNDVATATAVYPTWVTANSGYLPAKTSSTSLSFIPSTGILSATGFSGSGASLTSLTAANLLGTIPSAILANSTVNIGTTAVALNRASANLALTGISSIGYVNGSNTATLSAAVMAGNLTFTLPTIAGNLVGTGDSGTVTNAMLAGSIADSKLLQITTASKVSTGALTGTLFTLGSTTIAAGATVTSATGLVNLTGTGSIDFSKFLGLATDTVTTPSFTWTGDLTTGLYRPTTSQVAIAIAGVQRGLWSSAGLTVTGALSATALSGALNNAVTFNNSGAGVAAGTTYNNSSARTISWNTIGAQAEIVGNTNYFAGVLSVFTGNATYPIGNTPLANTLMVFVNGILQNVGLANDYTISGTNVIFTFTPAATDVVLMTYFK